jgi:hypothetical protein
VGCNEKVVGRMKFYPIRGKLFPVTQNIDVNDNEDGFNLEGCVVHRGERLQPSGQINHKRGEH